MGELINVQLPAGTVDRDTTINEWTDILAELDIFQRGTGADANKLTFTNDSGFYIQFAADSTNNIKLMVYNQNNILCCEDNGVRNIRLIYNTSKLFTYYKTVQGSIIFGWDNETASPQGNLCGVLAAPENINQYWWYLYRVNGNNGIWIHRNDDAIRNNGVATGEGRMLGGTYCSNIIITPTLDQRKDRVLDNIYRIAAGGGGPSGGVRKAIINNKQYIGFPLESCTATNISTAIWFVLDDPNEPIITE